MSYSPTYYGNRAETEALMPWYRVEELVGFIKAAQRINFSLNEPRQQVMQRLNGIVTDAPFSVSTRFPGAMYINGGFGDWPRKFQQVRLALSTKEKDKDDKSKVDDKRTDISDSLVAYHNALTAMMDEIKVRDGVFTRASFEAHYSLVWEDPN